MPKYRIMSKSGQSKRAVWYSDVSARNAREAREKAKRMIVKANKRTKGKLAVYRDRFVRVQKYSSRKRRDAFFDWRWSGG